MKKIKLILLILFTLSFPLFASNISFNGGYTKISMQEGLESITLENPAFVEVDNLTISATKITLLGKNYDKIQCEGKVKIVDEEKGLTILCQSLFFDRTANTISIVGGVEIDDTTNNLHSTALQLEYDINKGTMDMSVEVKLLHIADDSVMSCTCDTLRYDREGNSLVLLGNSTVDWKKDKYRAEAISVDMENNEISLEGSIEGTIRND